MPEKEENDLRATVARNEMIAAFGAGAPFVNKMLITLNGPIARLSFLELAADDLEIGPKLRAAVVMHLGDLLALRDLINRLEPKFVVVRREETDGE